MKVENLFQHRRSRILHEPYEYSVLGTKHLSPPKTWNIEPIVRVVELIFMLGAVLGSLYFLWAVTSTAVGLIWQGVNGQLIRWS